jgi:hypothetical protein
MASIDGVKYNYNGLTGGYYTEVQTGVLRTRVPSGISHVWQVNTTDVATISSTGLTLNSGRVRQEINSGSTWDAVNGYYGLSKDAYPALNPYSSGVQSVSTWNTRTSAADNSWRSVCWSPELRLFVAVSFTGAGNRVMTSLDGITWTSRVSASDNQWNSVCWSPELGLFVAVSYNGSG